MGVFRNKCHAAIVLILLGCLLCSPSGAASHQAYVEAVEADLDEFSSGTFNPPEDTPWVGSDSAQVPGLAKKSDNLESFSLLLKNESPGTFIFYKKLPLELKKKVLEEYLEIGDIERTKKSILRYATNRKRN